MAKFWLEDDEIVSSDTLSDRYHKGELNMETSGNDYLGGTLEEGSSNSDSWNKVISGTKRNSDGTPNMGDVSDGYHTFDELYEHRSILFCSLLAALNWHDQHFSYEGIDIDSEPWYSTKHDDGTMFPGMFIAGITSKKLGSVTYHFDEKYLPLFRSAGIPYRETAPKWDGHTPEQGLEVLRQLFCNAKYDNK